MSGVIDMLGRMKPTRCTHQVRHAVENYDAGGLEHVMATYCPLCGEDRVTFDLPEEWITAAIKRSLERTEGTNA